jgi:uncharacterized damage-inducible protein DinB
MTSIPVWFERKFNFSFSVELFPNICTRLRGTPARLEEMLRARSRETLIRKPAENGKNKWSAQEQAGHLVDLEGLWLARVEDFVTGKNQMTVADLQNRKTDAADHNSRRTEEILQQFRDERDKLLRRLEQLDVSVFSRTLPHPRLQTPMRLVDHLYFVAEHDDHHLARIWELIREEK